MANMTNHTGADWGFRLSGKMHPESPGGLTLQIVLRKEPTEEHYDPEEIQLHLRKDAGALVWHKYHFLERQIAREEIGYTHILLKDRMDKVISFFAFGGWLDHLAGQSENRYTIQSEAPIIDLNSGEGHWTHEFAEEIDILHARVHAHFHGDDEAYARHLMALDTISRYAGSIQSICQRIEREREPRPESLKLLHKLQPERRFLTSKWGSETLEERLGW